jgi:hypothetical protein
MGRIPSRCYKEWHERKLTERARLNEIILTEEMKWLLTLNVRYDITYVLKQLALQNELLHWLCTSQFALKEHVLLSVRSRNCSVCQQYRP